VGSPLTGVTPASGSGAPQVEAQVATPKVFFDDGHPALLSVLVKDAVPATVSAELIRLSDGAAIAHWDLGQLAPATVQSVEWDGLAGGKLQREGRYAFEITATNASGAGTTTAATVAGIRKAGTEPAGFLFLPHMFPIGGRHEFGEGGGHFGAERGGHSHEGQDVFADCGTPLLAARGGKVRWKGTQALAGNYLVIDGEKTGVDYAYMHLRDAALVDKGDRVLTGQPIGFVGDTGDASECHLHFEMWSAPGWYRGGSPFDPLPSLRSWDRTS
jgi:murein DD-endopeptidase MepM/ murein hydrolase activator NlpD